MTQLHFRKFFNWLQFFCFFFKFEIKQRWRWNRNTFQKEYINHFECFLLWNNLCVYSWNVVFFEFKKQLIQISWKAVLFEWDWNDLFRSRFSWASKLTKCSCEKNSIEFRMYEKHSCLQFHLDIMEAVGDLCLVFARLYKFVFPIKLLCCLCFLAFR